MSGDAKAGEVQTVDTGYVHVCTGLDSDAHHEHDTPARDRILAGVHVSEGASHERADHGTELCTVSRRSVIQLTQNSSQETLGGRCILLIELDISLASLPKRTVSL